MAYRDELEVLQLRVNTLEAKLDETKASLNARDAELAECRNERDRLRKTGSAKASFPLWGVFAVGGAALVIGVVLGLGFASGRVPESAALPAEPAIPPTPAVVENGPEATGHVVTPIEPPNPPAAIVSGRTNVDPSEITIESVLDDSRSQVRDCYRKETDKHPDVSGSVKVLFDIETSGKVSRIELKPLPYLEPWWSKDFEKCVMGVYRGLTFPATGTTKTTAEGKYFFTALDRR